MVQDEPKPYVFSPDPTERTTEQLFRVAGDLRDRLDRQGDMHTAYNARLDDIGSSLAALAARQDGDIKRLTEQIEWSKRAVDSAQLSHNEVHKLVDKHVDIAREQQQLRNDALNNERARQTERDNLYAQKETVGVEVAALRNQIERNDLRIQALELALRGVVTEDTTTASNRRSGQANIQQYASIIGAIVAVIAVIATIVIANLSTAPMP